MADNNNPPAARRARINPNNNIPDNNGGPRPAPDNGMAGQFFYDQARGEDIIYQPYETPSPQASLREQTAAYDALRELDTRYARNVAGVACMALDTHIMVPRHEIVPADGSLSTNDLRRCNDAVWAEVVRRRFLSAADGTAAQLSRGMLDIVRDLNLEMHRFTIVGLHQRVEAAEHQIVQTLMMQGSLDAQWDIHETALRLRRSDSLWVVFSTAVGAYVLCNAALAVGTAEYRYNRDLSHANRDRYYNNLRSWLNHMGAPAVAAHLRTINGTDYVVALSRMRIVRRAGGASPAMPPPAARGGGDDSGPTLISSINNSTAGPLPATGAAPPPLPPPILDTLDHKLDGIIADINTLDGSLQQIMQDIQAGGADINALKTAFEAEIMNPGGLRGDVRAAMAAMAALRTDLTALATAFGTEINNPGGLRDDVRTALADVATLQANLAALAATFGAEITAAGGLRNDVRTALAEVAALRADLATLNTTFRTQIVDPGGLRDDVNALRADQAANTTALGDVALGLAQQISGVMEGMNQYNRSLTDHIIRLQQQIAATDRNVTALQVRFAETLQAFNRIGNRMANEP